MSSSRDVLRSLPFASSLASHNKMRTAKQLLLECLCTQAQVQVCKSCFFFFLFTNAVPTITMSNVIWTARNQNCKQQLHKDLKCTLLQLTKPVWVPGHSPCWMISSKHIYTCSRHIYKKKRPYNWWHPTNVRTTIEQATCKYEHATTTTHDEY